MKAHILKYWRIFWKLRSLFGMTMVERRGNFFFWGAVSAMWSLFHFFFYGLIVNVTGEIAGWTKPELFTIWGLFAILDAFIWSWFYPNMRNYAQMVFDGELNRVLLQPIDTQFALMAGANDYNNISRLLIGSGMVLWATRQLPIVPSISQWLLAGSLLLLGAMFIYLLWFCLTTLCFYIDRLENINEVVPNVRHIYEMPNQIFQGLLSGLLTVVLPVGLVTTLPSEALIGRLDWRWAAYLLLFTLVLFWVARRWFYFSIKNYSGQAN